MRYLITLSEREDELFLIVSEREWKRMQARGLDPEIVGVAKNKNDAFERVREMVEKNVHCSVNSS